MTAPLTPGNADSRERIIQVARRLFGERGYTAVTIRAVASEADVSPALVMKVAGSKEGLFALATPTEPTPLGADVPVEGLGEHLVRRMLQRREEDAAEPWLRAVYLLLDAPDPAAVRAEFRERILTRFPHSATASTSEGARYVDELACLLLGLAAGLRTFRLFDPQSTDLEAVAVEYGAIVQQVLDRLAAAVKEGRTEPLNPHSR
ncbi:MAG: TetR/AcrR family transcriptional regulator [Intrasporangiaceae bacterium]|nr:TetR/AcrR family transcriptional regulator [Intrasporangiaceae bacterium]